MQSHLKQPLKEKLSEHKGFCSIRRGYWQGWWVSTGYFLSPANFDNMKYMFSTRQFFRIVQTIPQNFQSSCEYQIGYLSRGVSAQYSRVAYSLIRTHRQSTMYQNFNPAGMNSGMSHILVLSAKVWRNERLWPYMLVIRSCQLMALWIQKKFQLEEYNCWKNWSPVEYYLPRHEKLIGTYISSDLV